MATVKVEDYLATLRTLKPELAVRYKVRSIGLFGSVVRGEQDQASDIDLLVDFEEDADLLDLTGLALFLEQVFQREVDIVPRRALRVELRSAILREVIPA
nr:nucleotidyltransferase family protein [Chloroflexota bacterium]